MNVGSSVCLCSNDESLLQWVCSQAVESITKEYLILSEPGIDDVRYMMDFVFSSTSDGYKVVFIHRSERILQEAANSMLKILEEPPLHSVIVLTTTRFTDLLATIRSRVKTLNISIDKNIVESLRKKFAANPKIDLIIKLCSNDFDLLNYMQQVDEFEQYVQFDQSQFVEIFTENQLSAQNKMKASLMLDDLYIKLSNWTEKDLINLYIGIQKSNKIDLNAMIFFMCRVFQTVLELHGCRDASTFKWLDLILANRLMNFNGPLTLLNMLILVKRSSRR